MADAEASYIETFHAVAYVNAEEWALYQPDGVTPVDLTGKAFTCHARLGTPDAPGAVVLEISTANGLLTLDGAAGLIGLDLSDADLLGLDPGDYCYELVDVTGGGADDVIDFGYWSHLPTGVGADESV